ncbi:hypothetical protein [Lysinibacillus pakistanensis]|uniref:Uncharacterized protein n=1 Tax=Lysinibacillus pakistanensis TaxID=759811 RepID=A0AAX3WVF5_9BACI|nr:hypothetical protein [Lysinibacillus pakistanensis]MDM5230068.1 hypothetical protein [Lysinibacillus pakistanensis]QGG52875.1 hypothetical protein GDS87_19085 [Lysinibacillus pakistanensis]WHY45666.1 hypothetical protein QNH22_20680 [Lysinibacillus pakistanensis]WHY50674.1 hypothetical protein QNH24_20645 [Lysinibacillus pakistanensis]
MTKYTEPTLVEYGQATNLIQGCGGWGLEGLGFNDSDRQYRYVSTDKVENVCICTTLAGNGRC